MMAKPFTPYWRHIMPTIGPPEDPNSWVFFVVAQIAGHHRPVAVVSSTGGTISEDETLQGYPLTFACQHVATIFTERANRPAIRAELALAAGYYRNQNGPEPVELPELYRGHIQNELRNRPWDRTSVCEFPFIMACLLQGIGLPPEGYSHIIRPEPLGTVYRDDSIEWGMVVVDITKLDAVRYGIVGFGVSIMKFVATPRDAVPQGMNFAFEQGELRVVDEVRPRSAMSAAKYMAKFNHPIPEDDNIDKLLAQIPLIDVSAMDLVWPQGPKDDIPKNDILLSPIGPSVDHSNESLSELGIRVQRLIQSAFDVDDFDLSIFDEVHTIPYFQDFLWTQLVEHSSRLGSTRSGGKLIRLAFADQEHLGLEQLNNLPVGAILEALGVSGMKKVTSISLCIDSIRGTPAQLVHVLSGIDTLRELYFLQSPTRESGALSGQIFEELAASPQILRRTKVMLAGAYSAAVRKKFWLPTVPKGVRSNIADTVQVAPLDVFPIQQMFIRSRTYDRGIVEFNPNYVYLGDALLKPEHFAAGFILFLHSLVPSWFTESILQMQLFNFSSAPASLEADPLTAAEVSPIPAESFAVPTSYSGEAAECWPRVRDLVPGGWTIIVSKEYHWDREGLPCQRESHFIRYAFIRARQQCITVDHPPLTSPGMEELEVIGLKEFLHATAPEVDPVVVDRRLNEVAKGIASRPRQGTLPPGIEPVSVLSQAEAADMLLGFLEDGRKMKKRLCMAMEENPRERNWYPELLREWGSNTNRAATSTLRQAFTSRSRMILSKAILTKSFAFSSNNPYRRFMD